MEIPHRIPRPARASSKASGRYAPGAYGSRSNRPTALKLVPSGAYCTVRAWGPIREQNARTLDHTIKMKRSVYPMHLEQTSATGQSDELPVRESTRVG